GKKERPAARRQPERSGRAGCRQAKILPKNGPAAWRCRAIFRNARSCTAVPMVRRLAAGGRRIRTRGPTENETGVRGPGGKHLGLGPDLNLTGFGFRAGVLDGRPAAEPFAGAGPALRIRFAPAESLRTLSPFSETPPFSSR